MDFEGLSNRMMSTIAGQGRHGCRIVDPPSMEPALNSNHTPLPPNHAFLFGDTKATLNPPQPGRVRCHAGLPGGRSEVVLTGSVNVRTGCESHLLP
jgi:hypothetical protein